MLTIFSKNEAYKSYKPSKGACDVIKKFIGKSEAPAHIPLERNTHTEQFFLLIVFSEYDINKTINRAAMIYDALKNENSNLQASQKWLML